MNAPDEAADIARQVASRQWYHTIEVAPGVVTPGWFDTRAVAAEVPIPKSLEGMRCLDVGTFDGFWAFEMERRGASEVVAIDLLDPDAWDWPALSETSVQEAIGERKENGVGFEFAREQLGSKVVRHELSIYDLDERFGEFDFIYLGSLLLHLRDPVRALERAAAVCRGQMAVVDAIDLPLTLLARGVPIATLEGVHRPWWWRPTAAGLAQMTRSAGLEIISGPDRFFMPYGPGTTPRRPRLRQLRTKVGIDAMIHARWGDPHAAVLTRPRQA